MFGEGAVRLGRWKDVVGLADDGKRAEGVHGDAVVW